MTAGNPDRNEAQAKLWSIDQGHQGGDDDELGRRGMHSRPCMGIRRNSASCTSSDGIRQDREIDRYDG